MVRTAVIYQTCFFNLEFFIVDEDWSRLDGVFANSCDSDPVLIDELMAGVYDAEFTAKKVDLISRDLFIREIRKDPNMLVIECGELP
jgi:hypothetical protein